MAYLCVTKQNNPIMEQTKAQKAHQAIQEALAAGRTVYLQAAWNITKVTPKNARKWAEAGLELFKLVDGNLCMARGRNYDIIVTSHHSLVKITFQ